jgi:hypothetical protein
MDLLDNMTNRHLKKQTFGQTDNWTNILLDKQTFRKRNILAI